jgi:hypothetical protein
MTTATPTSPNQGQPSATPRPASSPTLSSWAALLARSLPGWRLLLIVFGTALLRWLLASPERVVWGDEPFYLWIGRNWLTGQGYTFTGYSDVHHTAGYPLLSGLLFLLTSDLELSSRLLYIICGALFPLPIYAITARLYDTRTALIAALLTATWPTLNGAVINWGTLTEPPYYLCIYLALALALPILLPQPASQPQSPGLAPQLPIPNSQLLFLPWFLTAALLTLAYHIRPEAIAHILAIGGYLLLVKLLEQWATRLPTWRQTAQRAARALLPCLAAYTLGFALLWLPYGYYVSRHTGSWQISEKAGVTYVTSKSLAYGDTKTFDKATWGLDSTGKEVFFFSHESYNVSMSQVIMADPLDFIKLLYQNIQMFLGQLISLRMFPFFLLPLIGLGWFAVPWDARRLKGEGLLWVAILPVLAFLLFFIQERYIATLLPILIIWTAHGLARLGFWLTATLATLQRSNTSQSSSSTQPSSVVGRRSLVAFLPALLLCLALLALTPTVMAATSTGSWRHAHRTIGLWLKPSAHDAVVMSRYPAIAFHADAHKWVATPNAEIEAIRPYLTAKQVRYWVIDEREIKLRPQFKPLVEGQAPPWLHLLHQTTLDGEQLVVYEVSQ